MEIHFSDWNSILLLLEPTVLNKLPQSAFEYRAAIEDMGHFEFMQTDVVNNRQEVVGGYVGETDVPTNLQTLPDFVHQVTQPMDVPSPSPTWDIYSGVYK